MNEPGSLTIKENYAKSARGKYGCASRAGVFHRSQRRTGQPQWFRAAPSGNLFVQNLCDGRAQIIQQERFADHVVHTLERVA